MILESIELNNIGSHKHIKVEFDKPLLAICGPNGSGKTFLIESIPACLYGVFPSRSGSIYNKIGDDASIVITFMHGMGTYSAVRKMNKKKATSEGWLYMNGVAICGPKVSDFESVIRDMFGSYESYISSAFSSQKISGDICDFKPGQRKKFFSEMFGLEKLDLLSELANDKMLDINRQVKEAEQRVEIFTTLQDDEQSIRAMQLRLTVVNDQLLVQKIAIDKLNNDAVLYAELDQLKQKHDHLCSLSIPDAKFNDVCKTCPLPVDYYCELDVISRRMEQLETLLKDYDQLAIFPIMKINDTLKEEADTLTRNIFVARQREKVVADAKALSAKSIEDPTPYQIMSDAFGKNGIQPLIIESEKAPLESLINELLGILTEHKMQMSFSTLKELKDGRQAESLDIIIIKNGITLDVADLSGGEQRLVKVAIRMALAINNNRFKIKTLIIDEVFDDLDITNSQNVLNAIKSFSNYFARVIVVSHDDRLLPEFPALIDLVSSSS